MIGSGPERVGGLAVADDYSATPHQHRSLLAGEESARYLDFLRGLRPRYTRVALDILLGYLAIVLSAVIVVWLTAQGAPFIVATAVGSLVIGYWVAYLGLFMHEGSHFNLAPERDRSDQLSNILIGWLVGTSVERYRPVHFQHHRALGRVDDSEHTYFFPLSLLFIVKGICGWRVIEVVTFRRRYLARIEAQAQARRREIVPAAADIEADEAGAQPSRLEATVIAGLVVHAVIVGMSILAGQWALAAAWVVAIVGAFPFFGALRQLLEHRSEAAEAGTDYFTAPHGAYSRMFKQGPISSTLGGAGFTRHLLHHWEPQVSYTNLRELEEYLEQTPLGDIVRARRTTYARTFLTLFSLS